MQRDPQSNTSAPVVIAEWPRNNRETIRVTLDQYQGRDIVDLRCWYVGKDGEGLKPGRSGITLAVRHLPDLADGLSAALAHARRIGLLGAEDAAARGRS